EERLPRTMVDRPRVSGVVLLPPRPGVGLGHEQPLPARAGRPDLNEQRRCEDECHPGNTCSWRAHPPASPFWSHHLTSLFLPLHPGRETRTAHARWDTQARPEDSPGHDNFTVRRRESPVCRLSLTVVRGRESRSRIYMDVTSRHPKACI